MKLFSIAPALGLTVLAPWVATAPAPPVSPAELLPVAVASDDCEACESAQATCPDCALAEARTAIAAFGAGVGAGTVIQSNNQSQANSQDQARALAELRQAQARADAGLFADLDSEEPEEQLGREEGRQPVPGTPELKAN